LSSVIAFIVTTLASAVALAQEGAASNDSDVRSWGLIAASLSIGIAAFGGALGQGRTASSALSGISRQPNASGKILVPMILGLALIESLVIYALLVSFSIINVVKALGGG
jgi:F-type H+-transporting ATPase subunit c